MVTPLRGRDKLDLAGLERLIEHILGGGVSGLFILGTTGEGPSLSYDLRRELIDRTCQQVRGRVPILVGITDTVFAESVNLARHAANSGADALVLAPPYYFGLGQPELAQYLADLVAELPLPLFLYNAPMNTKVPYELTVVRRAMDMPQIVGLKDSSLNMTYFQRVVRLLQDRADWSLLIGPEELLAEGTLAGGHGGVPGGANLFPSLYVRLFEAAQARDLARTRELHSQVLEVSRSLYKLDQYGAAVIKGIKCALAYLGICDDCLAEPFHRFGDVERARVQQCLPDLVAGVEKLCSKVATKAARPRRVEGRLPARATGAPAK